MIVLSYRAPEEEDGREIYFQTYKLIILIVLLFFQ